jgi:hypothetical protein
MNQYRILLDLLTSAKDDFEKFYEKGIGVAGMRIRKKMQELKVLAIDIRKDVQDKKNAQAENSKNTATAKKVTPVKVKK